MADTVELLSEKCRGAFREACSDHGTIRQIERAFEDEGFEPAREDEHPDYFMPHSGWYRQGQRRGTFDRYVHHVDWTNPGQVRRVLNAFEQILTWIPAAHDDRRRLPRYLGWDGYTVDDHGHIQTGVVAALGDLPLEQLTDPGAIREHLDRITRAADDDPPLAISGAKALIEATTKLVLHELGEPVDERADVPALVKQANRALALHPEVIAPDTKGADTIRRTLGGLAQIAIGVAELRNLYGPDHGRSAAVCGLAPRHAHLAVGCASAYCRMLLDTLAARRGDSSAA